MFLFFVSKSPNLTRIQKHHLHIGHVTLIKYKYRQLYDKGKENERKNGFENFIAMYLSSCTCVYPSLVLIIFLFFRVTCLYGSLLNSLYGS